MTASLRRLPFSSLLVLALAAPALATAQTAPNAGQLLREVPAAPQSAPSASAALPYAEIARPALNVADAATVTVKTIVITGNTVVPTATLHALVAKAEGTAQTLAQLNALAARITRLYHDRGYILARAYLPEQEVNGGRVEIAVLEGRLGAVKVQNTSRVADPVVQSFLAPLKPGAVIAGGALERSLLLLSDVPGLNANSTLQPGASVGSSDLVVAAKPGPLLGGTVNVDNFGSSSSGAARVGGMLDINNLSGRGDQITLQALSSLNSGEHLRYGRAAYDYLLNGHGTRIGAGYARLDYGLGENFTALNAHGTADDASLWINHPLIRTQRLNVQAGFTYDYKLLKDHIDTSGTQNDRTLNVGALSLSGSYRDDLFSGGITSGSVSWGVTDTYITDAAARAADAAAAKTQGTASKWNFQARRAQHVTNSTTLSLFGEGQLASGNLDSADKFVVGGPNSVRAYPQGEVSGDEGWLLTVELQQALPVPASLGQWSAVAFFDSGHVLLNKDAFAAGRNERTLSGAGAGLRWAFRDHWTAKVDAAWRIDGGAPTADGDRAPRIWASLGYQF